MMKMLLVFAAALLMGIPQTARGLTTSSNLSTTPGPTANTTAFRDNPEVLRIIDLFGKSNIKDCIDKQKDVCTHEPSGNMENFNRENLCIMLKIYNQCIDNCGQALKDGVNQGLKDFSCGGCGFLHASLLVLIMAAFLHYFV